MNRGRGIGRSQVRHSGISIMSTDYLKVRRKPLVDRLTCPLCKNIYREATTICVCLHTFCEDCIYKKLEEDETNCCPVCKADLGSSPKETLRPDNNLRNLVTHIFPLENSTRREEISITSQVNNTTPEVTKRNAPGAKGAPQDSGMSQETIGKIHDDRGVEEKNNHLDQTPSPASSNYSSTASKKQHISWEMKLPQVACTISEPMAHVDSFKEANKGPSQNHLAHHKEAVYRKIDFNKTSSNIPAFDAKNKDKVQTKKKRNMNRRPRESLFAQRKDDEKIVSSNIIEEMPKPYPDGVERTIYSGEQNEQELADEVSNISSPIWFCLLACEDKAGNALPQIPKRYIRVNDRDMPVQYINKYLVQKLNLKHESEVEVMCCGKPLMPSLTLNNLVNIWVQNKPSLGPVYLNLGEGISDEKKFLMELTYRRSKENGAPL